MLNTTCPVCNPRYDRYSQSMPMVADSPETGAVYQCLKCKRKFRLEWFAATVEWCEEQYFTLRLIRVED